MIKETRIIPIASGKGGVGKSFITTNLAIMLAKMGHPTVVVDLDLGGSNLHTCLGIPNQHQGIGDFLHTPNAQIKNFLVPTQWRNLKFIPGDGRTPFTANLTHLERMQLIMRLKTLPADFILLDLGAGSSFNGLDFFRISDHGLIVTAPEQTSMMNMLTFLKNMIFRAADLALAENEPCKKLLQEIFREPITAEMTTVETLIRRIGEIDSTAAKRVKGLAQRFRPRIILNRGTSPDDLKRLQDASLVLRDILSLETDHFGFIFQDQAVTASMDRGVPLVESAPESLAAINITYLAERIIRWWDEPLHDSEARLYRNTMTVWQDLQERKQEQQMIRQRQQEEAWEAARTPVARPVKRGVLDRIFGG